MNLSWLETTKGRRRSLNKARGLMLSAIAIFACVLAIFPAQFWSRDPGSKSQTASTENPARENAYVGSRVCADCHRAIYNVYSETDMGRSMSRLAPQLLEKVPNSEQMFDTKLNRHFEVSVADGNLYQHDYEIARDGKEVFRDTRKIEWIIGSGANGFGAIVRRDDVLFEAPLSYYSRTHHWGLSPGYEAYDFGFSRPIQPQCITCHSGRPRPVLNGNGRFAEPPFAELAIGCENCHGPGSTHVLQMRDHGPGKKSDDSSIVNPAKIPSWLADNICTSCHQTGDARVLQPGKSFQDFRPGTALRDTLMIFMVPPKRDAPPQSDLLEHYFSMILSKCYRSSGSKLKCITCHDPHIEPDRQQEPAYFRSRCLTCHMETSCAIPISIRQRQAHPDDCAGCHMPKRDVKEVSHSVLTNHRILRETGERYPDATFNMTSARLPDLVQLDGMPGRNDALIPPIILLQAYGQLIGAHPEYRERYVALAEELRRSTPNDIYVLEALAYGALAKNGEEGTQQAIEYLTRAIGQGSTLPGDFEQLGNLLMNARRFPEGAELIALGIKTIPHDGELHRLLGVCYLAQNRTAEARDVLKRASQRFPENDAIRTLLADSEKSTR
jgi:hypothetical protein